MLYYQGGNYGTSKYFNKKDHPPYRNRLVENPESLINK